MKKQTILITIIALIILINLTSCAPAGYSPKEYGFFSGIIHGLIFPFVLIGKLFGSNAGLYALNNTGFFYWLGFIFGISALGGSGYASRRRDY